MTQQPTVEKPAPAPAPAAAESSGKPRRGSGHWVMGIGGLAAVALVGSLAITAVPRLRHEKALDQAAATAADSPPRVSVATARRAPETSELTLPGNALPYRDAGLYARTNGYVKAWLADIGDHVKEGQLLAEISAPDVDDQLAQARANLVLAKANLLVSQANLELAKITLKRDLDAGVGQGTAPGTIDQDRAQVKTTAAQVESAKASIEVNQATVKQYEDLVAFQKIVAPFDGVITSRNIDPGVLVTADNPSETRPILHVMQTDVVRVFVNVPQVYSTSVAPGQEAVLYRQEDPTRHFKGKVVRTANALDPNTRTLLTQVDVPNPDDALRPGMYLQVTFIASRAAPTVIIPSAALMWRSDGTFVEVLDKDNTVRYRKVQTGRDYGLEVEAVSGLNGGETVIVHPGDALAEGQKVEPVSDGSQKPPADDASAKFH